MQITEAYKKLNSVMEGKESFRGDDSHEIAAFMRMFMDMVGISENDSIPAGTSILYQLLSRLLLTNAVIVDSGNDFRHDVWLSTQFDG